MSAAAAALEKPKKSILDSLGMGSLPPGLKLIVLCSFRLDTSTMFKVREWERFQFAIDFEHRQVEDCIILMTLFFRTRPKIKGLTFLKGL